MTGAGCRVAQCAGSWYYRGLCLVATSHVALSQRLRWVGRAGRAGRAVRTGSGWSGRFPASRPSRATVVPVATTRSGLARCIWWPGRRGSRGPRPTGDIGTPVAGRLGPVGRPPAGSGECDAVTSRSAQSRWGCSAASTSSSFGVGEMRCTASSSFALTDWSWVMSWRRSVRNTSTRRLASCIMPTAV